MSYASAIVESSGLPPSPVGAVCDRAFLFQSRNNARSSIAPTARILSATLPLWIKALTMADDEVFVLIGGSVIALICWSLWLYRTQAIGDLFNASSQKTLLALAPVVCAVVLFVILKLYASHDVRDAAEYLLLYQSMGAGWVGTFA